MEISDFGKKLTERSGILSLMDDLGRPLPEGVTPYPLGGGNPARVEEVERLYEERMKAMLESKEFLSVISAYDAPQGRMTFLKDIASYFSKRYGWPVSERNIAVTSGSQMSMFFLFNLFSGRYGEGEKHILFPLMPEYVGYADQSIYRNMMRSVPSRLEYYDDHSFKYILDKGAVSSYLDEHDDVGAIAFSRPTNPSGNVLRDDEVQFLSSEAERHGIPLIIDNAYGLPFPSIIFSDAHITWNENIILSMSLSKIGLPSIRTGIVVASEEVIEALSLKDIETLHGRAEDMGQDNDYRESFDIAVSRAVARLNVLSEYSLPFVKPGGAFIPYKSGDIAEELKEAKNAIAMLGGHLERDVRFRLPSSDMERSLIIIRKAKPTPSAYPRKAGVPSKKPIM